MKWKIIVESWRVNLNEMLKFIMMSKLDFIKKIMFLKVL